MSTSKGSITVTTSRSLAGQWPVVMEGRWLRSGGHGGRWMCSGDLMERKEEEKRILVRHGFVNFSRISSSEFLIYKTRF